MNEIFFLIYVLDSLLLVYRNTIDFCLLILCTATLVNSLIRSNSSGGDFSIFYIQNPVICRDSFTSSFQIWMPFISFSSLIAMARTSKTMLSNSGKSGHPCFVPDLEKCFQFFIIENDVCCGFVIYGLYYVEAGSHCLPTFWRVFIINGG